jgi:hypothetical protein
MRVAHIDKGAPAIVGLTGKAALLDLGRIHLHATHAACLGPAEPPVLSLAADVFAEKNCPVGRDGVGGYVVLYFTAAG